MSNVNKLSLSAAILISINVMVGMGLFVNTVVLTRYTGAYSALVYAFVGLILLPLVLSFAHLLNLHEGAGFYDYAAPMHPLLGFISVFGYFVARLASCALGIHVFVVFMQQIFPVLAGVPALVLDGMIAGLFVLFNMFGMRTGQSIQYGFLALKSIPVIFVIVSGLYLFSGAHFQGNIFLLGGMTGSIPLALFAFSGFEACCSIGKNIEDAHRNASRALLAAYLSGVVIVVLYQFLFYAAMGDALRALSGYVDAFPALVKAVFPSVHSMRNFFNVLLPIGIASSALGAAYGNMFSNSWNLFRLASDNLVPFADRLKKFNKNNVPFLIVILQGLIVIAYQLYSRGNQIPLQQISALGVTLTYTISMCALIFYQKKHVGKLTLMPFLGLGVCCILLLSFLSNVRLYGGIAPSLFLAVLAAASVVFLVRRHTK